MAGRDSGPVEGAADVPLHRRGRADAQSRVVSARGGRMHRAEPGASIEWFGRRGLVLLVLGLSGGWLVNPLSTRGSFPDREGLELLFFPLAAVLAAMVRSGLARWRPSARVVWDPRSRSWPPARWSRSSGISAGRGYLSGSGTSPSGCSARDSSGVPA